MKKNTMLRSALSLSLTAAFCLSIAACGSAETLSPSSGALPVKALTGRGPRPEKGAAAARRPPAISVWILYHNICRPRIHFQSSVRTLHRGAIRVPLALRQRRGGTSGYGLCELTQGT